MSRMDPPDEAAVYRAVWDPAPPRWLSRAERRLAGRKLLALGESSAAIAARLEVDPRTVKRWRAEDRRTRDTRSEAA